MERSPLKVTAQESGGKRGGKFEEVEKCKGKGGIT